MKLVTGLAILSLALTACTPEGTEAGLGGTSTAAASPRTSQPSEHVDLVWPAGTVTCAELEGNFPSGVDDHRLVLDQGLVSYDRSDGAGSVEEVFIQFLDDPTCTVDSDAWMFLIGGLLNGESLYLGGGLCDFYRRVQEADPPPANLDAVLEQLADAERLCG